MCVRLGIFSGRCAALLYIEVIETVTLFENHKDGVPPNQELTSVIVYNIVNSILVFLKSIDID